MKHKETDWKRRSITWPVIHSKCSNVYNWRIKRREGFRKKYVEKCCLKKFGRDYSSLTWGVSYQITQFPILKDKYWETNLSSSSFPSKKKYYIKITFLTYKKNSQSRIYILQKTKTTKYNFLLDKQKLKSFNLSPRWLEEKKLPQKYPE